jgi:nicotinamidase-related amidase
MARNSLNVQLLIIDGQNDFVDPRGALSVPGADEDMERLSAMIDRVGKRLTDIHATVDTHHLIDIAHPIMWIDSQGNHPDPFTIISKDDVLSGKWNNVLSRKRGLDYVTGLEANGRYPLCIWPPHCLIGSWGFGVYPILWEALTKWEREGIALVNYVTKGSNLWTEHYSAVQADVLDPMDAGTMLNTGLIQILEQADIIGVAGEALSHCLANTVRDIAVNFGTDSVKKIMLLRDCTSPVPGFENLGEQFITDLQLLGMQVTTSDKFLR